ncbi:MULTISPECIES: hypothetical protein [Pseudoalteromonas]|uniref:hypothetical protein n=1 Tax=Pseudoalteromonas TaxID=53246 RepID=UPI000C3415A5|nr:MULTISPECIES: hypothetical protein [Pseudoalteromonas]PKG62734.1 hypothetical protein CXF75_17995 [Pseudoalteromonas arctica]PKG70470.1 hypothetical protein CXF64_10835 [Pseudoalteromonas sp. GutCa3]
MFDLNSLKGKVLIAVSLSHIHEKVHLAWQDKSNEGFLICYEITLEFEDGKTYLIKPCEVDAIGYYPSLGLSIEPLERIELFYPFNISKLPSRICDIVESDHLGEGVVNQFTLTFDNEKNFVIRHVYPPMTMGIRVG